MKKFNSLIIVFLTMLVISLFNGCSTPGTIEGDRLALVQQFSAKKNDTPLKVVIEKLPGTFTSYATYAPGVTSKNEYNSDKIALDEAKAAFSQAFSSVEVLVKGLDEEDEEATDDDAGISLFLDTSLDINQWNGVHTATIKAKLIDAEGNDLLNIEVTGDIKSAFIGLEKTRQRAFLAAYSNLINQILSLPALNK